MEACMKQMLKLAVKLMEAVLIGVARGAARFFTERALRAWWSDVS
jgi:hypothetical protein